MYVEFITTSSDNLRNVPVIDGQIIALSDKSGYYYDMGSTRHAVCAVEIVSKLPQSGQLNKLYVRNNPLGLFIWTGSKYSGIESAPNDGYSYISKNGEWSRVPFIYDCTNTRADTINIQNIINNFNNSDDITQYLDIRYNYGDADNTSDVITILVKSGKTLHLNFSNMQITTALSQFIDITVEEHASVYINGLYANVQCDSMITLKGQGAVHISDCKFSGSSTSEPVGEAISSYDKVMLEVSNCEFNLDTINTAIRLYGESPVATITKCRFLTKSKSTKNKSCYIDDSNTRNVQIYGNYLPVRTVLANDSEICIQFSNAYPLYYERYRWMNMSDTPHYSYAELIGIWEEI